MKSGAPPSDDPNGRLSDQAFLRQKGRPDYFEGGQPPVGVVDLFCGCGGMTLGLAEASRRKGRALEVPLALDLDETAIAVYKDNFPKAGVAAGDVSEYFPDEASGTHRKRKPAAAVGPVDFLVGGPPCQGNSDLNNHTRRKDQRNALYAAMARAAEVLEAKHVIIENVPAVLRDHGRVVEKTTAALERLGYSVVMRVVDMSLLGVPQVRRRHVLVASLAKGGDELAMLLDGLVTLDAEDRRDLRWAIGDLEDTKSAAEFDRTGRTSQVNKGRIDWLFDNNAYDLDNSQRPPCHRDGDHSYKSVYGRMKWDSPAQTVTTGFGSMGQGRYVHPSRRRTITPHEAARIQTFPDSFSFEAARSRTHWARLIGNAVPPLLTLALGRELISEAHQEERVCSESHSVQPSLRAASA